MLKPSLFHAFFAIKICIFFCSLALLGCPFIDHGASGTPELVTAEDARGCYFRESFNEDSYINKRLDCMGDNNKLRKKKFNRVLCKKVCFDGDSALINVRGFALIYDSTDQYIEDTIRYTVVENTDSSSRSTNETYYEKKIPVLFIEPSMDGSFRHNAEMLFPDDLYLYMDRPGCYAGAFEMNVRLAPTHLIFLKEDGYKSFTTKIHEFYTTKGWTVCSGL